MMNCCLKVAIPEITEDLEFREKPMKVGIISSQFCQYSKKADDFKRPWTMTMKGSTPRRRRCVVLPTLKLWPYIGPRS